MTAPFNPDPNAGVGIPMVDPSQIPLATQDPNAPPGPAPITAEHVPGFIDRLFPTGGLGQVLDPEMVRAAQRHALLEMGARLFAASGPRPQGTSSTLSRIGEAVGGATASWPQQLGNLGQQAMQMFQLSQALQGRRLFANTVQKYLPPGAPAPSGGTAAPAGAASMQRPFASGDRLNAAATELLMSGNPVAMDYAGKLFEFAKLQRDSEKWDYEEGKGPNGEPGKWAIRNGQQQYFIPKAGVLTSEQQVAGFREAMKPHLDAANAWQQYRNLAGRTDRVSIQLRAGLANTLYGGSHLPDTALSNPDVVSKIPIVGPALAAAMQVGKMSPEDAANLDQEMLSAAREAKRQSGETYRHQRVLAGSGELGFGSYSYDPWENVDLSFPGTARPSARPAGYYTKKVTAAIQ
jgi:hypothetical protein